MVKNDENKENDFNDKERKIKKILKDFFERKRRRLQKKLCSKKNEQKNKKDKLLVVAEEVKDAPWLRVYEVGFRLGLFDEILLASPEDAVLCKEEYPCIGSDIGSKIFAALIDEVRSITIYPKEICVEKFKEYEWKDLDEKIFAILRKFGERPEVDFEKMNFEIDELNPDDIVIEEDDDGDEYA